METDCVECFYRSLLFVNLERVSSWFRNSSVDNVTRLRPGWSRSKRWISRLSVVPTQPSVHWLLGFKLTTYLHLVPRLRLSGAIPLLPLYVFMAWTGTALPFYYCRPFVTEEILSSIYYVTRKNVSSILKTTKKKNRNLAACCTDRHFVTSSRECQSLRHGYRTDPYTTFLK
jgi:hypothetical protein